MKIQSILLLSLISLAFTFTSCEKGDLTTPPGQSGINYQLKTVNTATVVTKRLAGTQATSIEWTSGYASSSFIKLEAKQGTSEVEFKFTGSKKIDLFSPAASTLGNIKLPAGSYNEVEFKAVLNNQGSDAALELNGKLTIDGAVTPVSFRVNDLVEIKAEKNNVQVTDNSSYTAFTTIDLSLLTSGITQSMLSSAQVSNGTLVISSASNKNLYQIILNNLGHLHACEFEHD